MEFFKIKHEISQHLFCRIWNILSKSQDFQISRKTVNISMEFGIIICPLDGIRIVSPLLYRSYSYRLSPGYVGEYKSTVVGLCLLLCL